MKTVLRSFVDRVDAVNDCVGRGAAWLTLLMALSTFVIVILRYCFNTGWIWMQESVVYMHGTLFMLTAGYTLLHGGHVRVDIFYGPQTPTHKAKVDLFGSMFLLLPTCLLLIYYSFPYVSQSWKVLEGSQAAGGIPGVFLLKSVIPLGALLLAFEGLSRAGHCLLTLIRESDADESPLKETF
jgi:TRAP-type mannitol/chloroaromatic compound transport system permease small subunit